MRHGDRHERPIVAEIGRRKAGAAGAGFDEAGVAGEAQRAAVGDAVPARQPQRLAALAADLGNLGDPRHLVQQLLIVGLALLERVGGGARHPADLPLEVGHRLLDPPRGRLRLLVHPVGQRRLDAAVADPGLQRAVDREHEHDKAHQRDDVFGEQALTQEPDLVLDGVHPGPRALSSIQGKAHANHRRGRSPGKGKPASRPVLARIEGAGGAFFSLSRLRGGLGWGCRRELCAR